MGRYVVLVGRRHFSAEQKREIVAEASGLSVNVSAVARAHNIKPSLLFRWKREAFEASMQTRRTVPTGAGAGDCGSAVGAVGLGTYAATARTSGPRARYV